MHFKRSILTENVINGLLPTDICSGYRGKYCVRLNRVAHEFLFYSCEKSWVVICSFQNSSIGVRFSRKLRVPKNRGIDSLKRSIHRLAAFAFYKSRNVPYLIDLSRKTSKKADEIPDFADLVEAEAKRSGVTDMYKDMTLEDIEHWQNWLKSLQPNTV